MATKINEGAETHSFGVVDATKARRAVGARVSFQTVLFEAGEFADGPGTYFAWIGYATRAGEPFGASQQWRYCKTEKERFEQVEAYLAAAKARAFRKFAHLAAYI